MPKDEDIAVEDMAVAADGFLKRIPEAIRDTFTDHQITAIGQAFRQAKHSVDIRISVPLPWGRRYIVLLSGIERRSSERRRKERKIHPLFTWGNVCAILIMGLVFGVLVNMLQTVSEAFK